MTTVGIIWDDVSIQLNKVIKISVYIIALSPNEVLFMPISKFYVSPFCRDDQLHFKDPKTSLFNVVTGARLDHTQTHPASLLGVVVCGAFQPCVK